MRMPAQTASPTYHQLSSAQLRQDISLDPKAVLLRGPGPWMTSAAMQQ